MARLALKIATALWLLGPGAVAQTAYMTCQNGQEVGLVDLATARQVARWEVPGNPAGVAIGPRGEVYTVATEGKAVRRHDGQTGAVIAEALLDGGPTGIALDAVRGRVFVSDWFNARIFVLDDTSLEVLATLPTGDAPAGLWLSGDGRYLASADKDADQVTVFDAETLAHARTIAVGTRPYGLRFAPDGRLFVGNVGSNDLSVVDVEAGKVIATVPVGERPYGVAFAGGKAFVTNQYANTVSVIDTKSLSEIAVLDVGEYPEGIDTTAGGDAVVLANWFDNTVSVIDPKSLSVIHSIETCDGPRAFGRFLWEGGNP